jgi:hypothetical protein
MLNEQTCFSKNGRDSVRRYIFILAVLMSLGLIGEARCGQSMSSSGNTVSTSQLSFQPINTASAKLAAPVSTMPIKSSQGSMFTNMMQKFPVPNFLKSSSSLAPTNPLTKSPAAKTAAQVTKTLSTPK